MSERDNAERGMTMPTIGLSMIVKNETAVIGRCLASVRPLVDYVLIVDTGSSDGTQELIRRELAALGLPGEVVDEPWRDFASNRTSAMERLRARGVVDYALVIDADDELVFDAGFDAATFKAAMGADLYDVAVRHGIISHVRPHISRLALPFHYRGVLHEFLQGPDAPISRETAAGFHIRIGEGGARSRAADKFRRDAAVLEAALATETDGFLRTRYTFYLAQSWRDAGEDARAFETYLARADMGGWDEEIFWSLLNAARLAGRLGQGVDAVVALCERASAVVPRRAEAWHEAARACRYAERHSEAVAHAERGLAIPLPGNALFLERWIYEHGLLDEFAVSAYWVGRHADAVRAGERLLAEGHLPAGERERVAANLALSRAQLAPPSSSAPRAQLPVVCVFGAADITLRSAVSAPDIETTALDVHCFPDDRDLERILIERRPHVIVTFGVMSRFRHLMAAPFEVRRRWLHYDAADDLDRVGAEVFYCYLAVCIDERPDQPLVSVFTPVYRTGDRFLRPLVSMKEQTYNNWEWIVWDDSDDDGRTAAMVKAHAALDHRIRLIRPERHSGVIGEVKYNACALSKGQILVELDHDDALTPDALARVVDAAREFPEAGFFYTDYAEVDTGLNPLRYPDGWGYGLGGYRTETYRGRDLLVALTPGISPKTIRHLVAAPNHIRAWRRDAYFAMGGHSREIHVADDFELLVRTFLTTRMVHIPCLGYVQYQDGENTQRVRNKDIQRHVRYLRWRYDRRIHERFVALGVDDYVWDEAAGESDLSRPNPETVEVASWTATLR